MRLGTLLNVLLFTKNIGRDEFGNRYYLSRCKNAVNKYKRYVLYNGIVEPSKVPPVWHAWLHFMTDEIPESTVKYSWQQPFQPNLTGTKLAYLPESMKKENQPQAAPAAYQAWKPEQ